MTLGKVCYIAVTVMYAGPVQEVATRTSAPQPSAPQPSAPQPGAPQPGAPRRERKKQQTRDALIHAALELFEAKGYEHTTVREITDAVDVSERTFFRYFASKEDLALSFVRDATGALLQALAARPPAEEPLTALRRAFRESLGRLTADGGVPGSKPTYLSVLELIETTPALLAAHLRYVYDHDDDLVGVLARREGVDPATDPRPRILAAIFASLAALASRDWREAGAGDAESMLATFDAYADRLNPGLFGHWAPSAK
jgi:AcrR family transcriptional regulator